MLNFNHAGKAYINISAEAAAAQGVPAPTIGAALKREALAKITQHAETYRARLGMHSAVRVLEDRVKVEIAADQAAASAAELGLLDRWAAARGTDRTGLVADIAARGAAYREIILTISALEAETVAAVRAVADDAPDIAAQLDAILASAQAEAETAVGAALTLINGGT